MANPLGSVLTILRDALDLLSDDGEEPTCVPVSPLPCRTALYLGGEVPWDECGDGGCTNKDGMLWAKLIGVDPTQGGSDQGSCASYTWTAEFGIVRCISTGNGGIPAATAIEADAIQQAADADAIYTALRCCNARPESLRDVALTRWTPLGPQGKCAGGAWTVRGSLNVCC